MTIKFRYWIIVAEKLSSSCEELDIDLYKIVGIFISQIQKKMKLILSNWILKNSVDKENKI